MTLVWFPIFKSHMAWPVRGESFQNHTMWNADAVDISNAYHIYTSNKD